MTAAVEVRGLRKTYHGLRGRRVALDGLDLVVQRGQVHGFLGPNGSGKTTTIKALLGLVRVDDGEMRLLGEPIPARLPSVVSRTGVVLESGAFFLTFSGRKNLRLLATTRGVPKRRVDEVLEIVGLTGRGKDRVKAYSLGMRQRLAIAAALLPTPELLVLDEPNNGLDPAGIREVRDLMRRLASEGTTVLLSSHVLGEVQSVCDSVSIVARGRLVASGEVGEVLAKAIPGGPQGPELRVRVSELDRAAAVLTAGGMHVVRRPDHLLVSGTQDPSWISQTLGRQRMWVSELAAAPRDLEAAFLALTADPADNLAAPPAAAPPAAAPQAAAPPLTGPPPAPEQSPAPTRAQSSQAQPPTAQPPTQVPTQAPAKVPAAAQPQLARPPETPAQPSAQAPASAQAPTDEDGREGAR
jgi:ABC-2 type transport system ATP-binding protein